MTLQALLNQFATHRDYGPCPERVIATSYGMASRRFNFAYPRGELLLLLHRS